jgi:hypothetical protein
VEYTPIFDWHPPRSRKLSLISFIAASAMLHALCFYIFQIIYPPTVALIPPPARVSMITSDSEDGRLLLRWMEAEDPALSSMTQRPPDAATFALPKVEHVPSYRTMQPALKEPPPYQPDLSVPSARPPGPVPQQRSATPAAAATTPSTISFSEEIHSLGAAQLPPLKLSAASKEPPQAAQFRIAIGSRGEVRHAFLHESSGDSALDEQARGYLLQCRFPHGGSDLIWATATFEWGNDLAAP